MKEELIRGQPQRGARRRLGRRRRAPGCVPGARWPRPDAEEPRRYGPRAPTAPRVGTAARARRPEAHRGALPRARSSSGHRKAPGLPAGTARAACRVQAEQAHRERRIRQIGRHIARRARVGLILAITDGQRTHAASVQGVHHRARDLRARSPDQGSDHVHAPRSAAQRRPRARPACAAQRWADRGLARQCSVEVAAIGIGLPATGQAAAPRPPQDSPPTPGTCRGRRRSDPGKHHGYRRGPRRRGPARD